MAPLSQTLQQFSVDRGLRLCQGELVDLKKHVLQVPDRHQEVAVDVMLDPAGVPAPIVSENPNEISLAHNLVDAFDDSGVKSWCLGNERFFLHVSYLPPAALEARRCAPAKHPALCDTKLSRKKYDRATGIFGKRHSRYGCSRIETNCAPYFYESRASHRAFCNQHERSAA